MIEWHTAIRTWEVSVELKETMTVGSNNDKTRFEAAYIHARETMQSDTGRTLVEMMKTMHTRSSTLEPAHVIGWALVTYLWCTT